MTNKRKVMLAIKDHIYNVKQGYDMECFSFGILYKTGEYITVYGNELPDSHIYVSESKIAYCWEINPDGGYDSKGNSCLRDFIAHVDELEEFRKYINDMVDIIVKTL